MVRVFQKGDGGIAHLAQVEAAQVAGHAHRDALVGAHQHIGEGGGQQGGLLQLAIIVVHEVHCVLINVPEQLAADGVQLDFGVPAGRPGHISGVHLTKVALAVHKGMEQRAIAPGQADHGIIDGHISVGVELHGGPHHVGRLGPRLGQQPHVVHGVQQLPVGGLEAVDLRDGPGDDDRHGVGHVVQFQRLSNGLLQHLGVQPHHVGVIKFLSLLGSLLFCHGIPSSFKFHIH